MAYTNRTLKDGAGADFTAPVWTPGRDGAANSQPVVLSTEDKAALDAIRAALGGGKSSTVTRAANTTAYAAGDVVGGVIEIPLGVEAGGTFTLLGIDLMWNFGAVPAGMSAFTAHLYNATPPSALADNDAWDLVAGDRATYIGSALIGTPTDLGSTLFVSNDTLSKVMTLASGGTSIFAYLVTSAAYTPAATSETGRLTLRGYSNA
jgi:hypothetical protein